MLNKIFYGNEKPPKYYMNNKPVQAMYFNNDLIYKLITECNNLYFTAQSITVINNETVNLNEILVVEPEDCDQELIWSTNSNNISVVDGVVTVLNADVKTVTITVQCGDKTASIDVNIEVPCTSISLSKSSYTLDLSGVDSVTFTPTVVPSNTTDKIVWSSNKTSVATVTATSSGAKGTIFAKSPGTATITATCGGKSATVVITVEASCTGLSLSKSSLEFDSRNVGEPVSAIFAPVNTTDTITWKSSNTNVATVESSNTVSEAIIRSVGNGTCTVTATCGSKSATCSVSVAIVATGIKLNKTNLSFTSKGETQSLSATVSPSDAVNKTVSWSSSNDNVATVDSNGVVTSVGTGTCTIIASCGGYFDSCIVTFTAVPSTGIQLSESEITLRPGASKQITVSLSPSNTTDDISEMVVNSSNSGHVAYATSKVDSRTMLVTITLIGDEPGAINFIYGSYNISCRVLTIPQQ